MMLEGPLDIDLLDGRVARAERALERDRARLRTEEGRKDARVVDPLEGLRDVAGRSTFIALRGLALGPVQAPHRDALLRWVHELLQARVGWDLVVDEADARSVPDPTLARHLSKEGATAIAKTFDEALTALVDASHVAAAELALGRLDDLALPVAAVRNELRARRFEAARRLGLAHPWALVVPPEEPTPAGAPAVPAERPDERLLVLPGMVASEAATAPLGNGATRPFALARAVLAATEPLAVELHKRLRRAAGAAVTPAHAIHDAFAGDAREGWPARLGTRWLEDVFGAIAPRAPRLARLPRPVGGASFLRAAAAWGFALRLEGTARSLPFALARDPYPTDAFVFGDALAIAVAGRVFAKRKLGLPARLADAHARTLARTLFFTLRTTAALVALGMTESPSGEVEELSARVFGAPLPSALGAAWAGGGFSGASRVVAPARLLGAVQAHTFVHALVRRYDEDWFDNPRVSAHFAALTARPIWSGEVPGEGAVHALARAFEETLG